MARAYLSIGSNIDREHNVRSALDELHAQFGELIVSSVYESEAVGFDGDAFYNLVVGIDTDLTVGELFEALRSLEFSHGRSRSGAKFSSRTLDVDILTYDQCTGVIDNVELPRAEILHNAFVLWPLAEVAPKELHPVEQKSYQQLWDEYDKNKQKLWTVNFEWRGRRISQAV